MSIKSGLLLGYNRFQTYSQLIAIQHSLFALPFAYLGMFLGASGLPSARIFILATLAMVSARSAAMGLNRLIDRKIDKKNPRTKDRPSANGQMQTSELILFIVLSAVIFELSSFLLNPLAFLLSPLALLAMIVYPYGKRFSATCHYWMMPSQWFAPVGGYIAATGQLTLPIVILGLATSLWISAFDIYYALLDVAFDRSHGIHSIPADYSEKIGIRVATISQVISLLLFVLFAFLDHVSSMFYVGVVLLLFFLVLENRWVRSGLQHVKKAFDINLAVGPTLFIFTLISLYSRSL